MRFNVKLKRGEPKMARLGRQKETQIIEKTKNEMLFFILATF